MLRFEGRVAIVTGSSRGIGRATAERLVAEGGRVVLNSRNADDLEATATELRAGGAEVAAVAGNVSNEETVSRLVDTAVEQFGGIDLLVNNVAVSPYYGPLLGADPDRFAKTMVTNTWPTVALVQTAVAAGLGRAGGAVVNVSTIGANQVHPLVAPYTSSKAALDALTRALARELGVRGVRVNAVAPGLVRTEISRVLWDEGRGTHEAEILPLQRLGEPGDIAAAIAFLLSDDASWITGVTLAVDGGRLLVGGESRDMIGVFGDPGGER
jgi:NAD(P)-dependent dehydrogenase (short-subunit alcohol dehydrogenase family)